MMHAARRIFAVVLLVLGAMGIACAGNTNPAPQSLAPTAINATQQSDSGVGNPAPAADANAAIRACAIKTGTYVRQETAIVTQMSPVMTTLTNNPHDAAAPRALGDLSAQLRAVDVSMQAATCDPAATEFLSLLKSASGDWAAGADLAARGVSDPNGSLINDGTQRMRDGNATLQRASAILKTVAP